MWNSHLFYVFVHGILQLDFWNVFMISHSFLQIKHSYKLQITNNPQINPLELWTAFACFIAAQCHGRPLFK